MLIYDSKKPEGIRGTIFLTVFLLFFGYQLLNVFTTNSDMIVGVRVLSASVYGAVLYIYGGDAWQAVRKQVPDRGDFLIAGIWLSFFSQFCQSIYAILARLAGMPPWFVNSEILGPAILVSVVGGVLHVATPGAIKGEVPRRNRYALGFGVAAAILCVGILGATRPDIRPWLDKARPYIGDWYGTTSLPSPSPHAG